MKKSTLTYLSLLIVLGLAMVTGFSVIKDRFFTSDNLIADNTNERVLNAFSCNSSQMFIPPTSGEDLTEIQLYTARSDDGVTFADEREFIKGAGVPSVTQGEDGTLFAVFNWFPSYAENPDCYNKIAMMTSNDAGVTWDGPFGLFIEEFPDDYQLPYDPTIARDAEGKFRMFFTTHKLGMDEPFIYGSAVSEDGLHFTYDGIVFESKGNHVVDGSEIYFNGKWIMIAPLAKQNGEALQATSIDGRLFEVVNSNRPKRSMYWVGNMVALADEVRFYGSCGEETDLRGLCYSATTDGNVWDDPVLTNGYAGDPGVVYLDDGQFVIIYAEPRAPVVPIER